MIRSYGPAELSTCGDSLRALRRIIAILACLMAGSIVVGRATAQEADEEPPPPVPFAVINAAGVDRLLTDAQYVFEAAERPELMDWLNQGLGMIGNLDGVDREKPFGAMLFLDSGFPPVPFPVTYIPVKDERRLLDTMSLRGVQWKKSGTADNRYETVDQPHLKLRFSNGYAFLVDRGDWILDEELPDPVAYNEPLTSRYDVAVSVRIGAVPLGIRTVFLGFLRSSTESELQQRDNEPAAAFRIRRANGISMLEALEELLTQGDEIRIGWDASREQRTGVLEIVFNAVPDSDYAKHLKSLSGNTTTFHALANDSQPLTVIGSWKLDKREQKAYQEYLLSARETIELRLSEQGQPTTTVTGMYDALSATVEDGLMDLCFQFLAPAPKAFVIRGAVKLKGARTFGTSLAQFLTQIQNNPDVGQIDLNFSTHQGVMIHRIGNRNEQGDGQDLRFFGGPAKFYVGADTQAVWFALGGDQALPEMKQGIDLVRSSVGQPPPATGATAPFQLISRMNKWLKLPPRDRGDAEGPDTFRLLADEAFSGEDDALRIDVRPTETGTRVRIQLDEGYLRLLGLALGFQYDRTQL
ncbi:MAG: hypothetical protein KF861_17500 [Planctomycetaceae bacterium]|nr:hypothetical protein [Planctomycetaceae bacterium]